jgi:uncharacterized protein
MRSNALILVVSTSCIWSQAATAQSPSFDCSKARYPDEFVICSTPQLADLDNLIAAAYAYLKSTRGRPYADQVGIPFWRLRQACQSNPSCIRQRQIEALAAYQTAGAPVLLLRWVNSQEPPTSGGETLTTTPSVPPTYAGERIVWQKLRGQISESWDF